MGDIDVKTVGTVESLWRYPVKSMGGETVADAFMGFSGLYGDRCYAFKSSAARKGFPYLNANVQQRMLLYRPKFRYPERASRPPNLSEAMGIAPGTVRAHSEQFWARTSSGGRASRSRRFPNSALQRKYGSIAVNLWVDLTTGESSSARDHRRLWKGRVGAGRQPRKTGSFHCRR